MLLFFPFFFVSMVQMKCDSPIYICSCSIWDSPLKMLVQYRTEKSTLWKKGSVGYESYFRLYSNCFWLNIIRVLFSVFMRTYIFETSVSGFKAICPAENLYVIRNVSLNLLSMCHEEQYFKIKFPYYESDVVVYWLFSYPCNQYHSLFIVKTNFCVFSYIHLVMVHGHVF